jgi:hypothetical protein
MRNKILDSFAIKFIESHFNKIDCIEFMKLSEINITFG